MSTKVAGIDVHKKVLMVVVHGPGVAEQERGKFGTTTQQLRQLAAWLRERHVEEAVMEFYGPVLEAGLVRIGTAYSASLSPGLFQQGAARTQARFCGCLSLGTAFFSRRADLELCSGNRTASLADSDAHQSATDRGPIALA